MDEAARLDQCARLSERLQAHFRTVHARSMREVPICNDRLSVAGTDFRPCGDWAVGVVVTPWFMNVFAAPFSDRPATPRGAMQRLALPAGEVDFMAAKIDEFGGLLSCSLFSPMDEFVDQAAALVTAKAALDALLTPPAPRPEQAKAGVDRRALFRGAFAAREATP